jgi:peroxiredoxin Q/BCP
MKTLHRCLCWISAAVFAAAATPILAESLPLKVGDTAPRVAGRDQDGAKWKLKDDLGKQFVLLYFYPKDDTIGCTAEACGLRDRIGDLKQKGVAVVGVSFDSVESHKKFAFKYDLSFPLIADTSGGIAKAYGAQADETLKIDRRISFLIGLDGKIIHITDSPDPSAHLREMQAAIASLGARPAP